MRFQQIFKASRSRTRVAVLALALGIGGPAIVQADPFSFDPDGGGAAPSLSTNTLDYEPGNALSVGGNLAVQTFVATGGGVQTTFDTVFQARLGGILSPTSADITPAGLNNSFEITIVSRFQENVQLVAGSTTVLGFVPGGVNFIEMYFDTTPDANPLTGTGFNDGTRILLGAVTSATSNFTNTGAVGPLDNFGGTDNYPNIDSVSGTGSTSLQGSVLSIDPAFFTGGLAQVAITLFNTSNVLPFNQVDPSAMFVFLPGGAAPVLAGAGLGAPSLGAINGCLPIGPTCGGPDIQFQTDANQTFRAVPEPASFLLFGFGLLGIGGYLRARTRKTAK